MRNYFKSGDWNAICDSCGFRFKASDLKQRWDGLMVCSKDWEPRHPQTFLKVPDDNQSVPWARPTAPQTYPVCNVFNSVGIAGVGVAGCAVAGRSSYTG